ATAGRDGTERMWDLAERRYPVDAPELAPAEVARRLLERQLRARGIARVGGFGFAFDGRPPGWREALQELVAAEVAVPARIDGIRGDWFVHRDAFGGRFRPRSTLLSPFDPLISDRTRTENLFGFRFAVEIYVPKDQRRY